MNRNNYETWNNTNEGSEIREGSESEKLNNNDGYNVKETKK